MERRHPEATPSTTAAQPRAATSSARLRLAAIHSPAETSALPGVPISEAIAAHRMAARPTWLAALADRLPPTLRGRWGLDTRAVVALAGLALAGALVGGWYLWQSQPTVVDLPSRRGTAERMSVAGAAQPQGPKSSRMASRAAEPFPAESSDSATQYPTLEPSPRDDAAKPPALGTPSGAAVFVDVEGKVPHPGVQSLPPGSRVYDALRAAGGASPGLDLTALDLARPLTDGEQLRVGLPGAAAPSAATDGAIAGGASGSKSRSKRARPSQPVNLNTATAEQLQTLPNIGPALAQRILDWRTQYGRFTSVAQLRQIHGIGDRKFADIKDSVTV